MMLREAGRYKHAEGAPGLDLHAWQVPSQQADTARESTGYHLTPRVAGIERARAAALRLPRKLKVPAEEIYPEWVAARLEIPIQIRRLDGAKAQLCVRGGRAVIKLSDRLTDPADQRWAIAHELGHFILQHEAPPAAELIDPRPRDRYAPHRDIEAEADTFASNLLMPEAIVCDHCDGRPMTLDVPAQLARVCRVPLVAAAIRITELSFRICAMVLSQNGQITWVSPSLRFLAYCEPRTVGSVDARTLAGRFRAGRPLPKRPRLVPASAWLERCPGVGPDPIYASKLQEHAIAIDDAGTVLTMLWLPSDPPVSRREWMGLQDAQQVACCRDIALGLRDAEGHSP